MMWLLRWLFLRYDRWLVNRPNGEPIDDYDTGRWT